MPRVGSVSGVSHPGGRGVRVADHRRGVRWLLRNVTQVIGRRESYQTYEGKAI